MLLEASHIYAFLYISRGCVYLPKWQTIFSLGLEKGF